MISKQARSTRAAGRATFSQAMRAWFDGDFERCLDLCARVRAPDVDTVSQLALLRGRALLRLGRPDDAIAVVNERFVAHGTLDASLTARMLLGGAEVRRGEYRRGLAILRRAARAAVAAHPTIRSEIALELGLAYYALRRLDDADRALDGVSDGADIVHARALDLRGWIAVARTDYAAAAERFDAALRRLDACRHTDRQLEANAVKALAILAAERLDRRAWLVVEQRAARLDPNATGLGDARFAIAIAGSQMTEADGRCEEALRWSAQAESAAPTEASALYAVCRQAAVLRGVGERYAHRHLVERVQAAIDVLDDAALRGDDRQVLMAAAHELAAVGDVAAATALLRRYDELAPPAGTFAAAADPRFAAFRTFLEAAIADAANDPHRAHHGYVAAFQVFRRIGYHRRALLAALRIGELTGQAYLFEYVDATLRRLSSRSPLRTRARRRDARPSDPVVARLSRPERAVFELLCEGASTATIAAARGRSKQTIRNTVSRILTAFDVPDRQALLRECVRRGLIG